LVLLQKNHSDVCMGFVNDLLSRLHSKCYLLAVK